ncbi:MAG: asparagine synthase (glutamine-hydrolyzing) [Muriicola sp.]|nr:asparagine synthase (glutamine-hydrolyzing) [Muriicola sp.]
MCGITGFVNYQSYQSNEELAEIVTRMSNQLVHRGPDDSGVWLDQNAGIALGHRRLSIIDLSPEGHQPMTSSCGRYVIAFNGEIYNYRDIKAKLEQEKLAPVWRGHSDTEIMLSAISSWGLINALKEFNGMFAFALWDKQEKTLSLARDRLGEKPLFYGAVDGVFLFGSELKSLKAHPQWRSDIDRGALSLYLRYNYVPAPYSIYQNIKKINQGEYLTLTFSGGQVSELVRDHYWSPKEVAEKGSANLFANTEEELTDKLEILLKDSIKIRMEADVPIGAFLSGGVDSSVVVALMQQQSSSPVRTFSIGFHEDGFDEAQDAARVAQHLKTSHTELYVTAEKSMSVIPGLPRLYDEPFADSSQIPTFLVSEMAKQHVTVSLSGDGGDELFGGYTRYLMSADIWNKMEKLPQVVRGNIAKLILLIQPQSWDQIFRMIDPLIPKNLKQSMPGDKLHKLAGLMSANSPENIYKRLISIWDQPNKIAIDSYEPNTVLTDKNQWPQVNDFTHYMMHQDMVGYLPDDILVKVDRASMGVSLEARVPLLDHRIVEFSWQLPKLMKIQNKQGKCLLRNVLYRHVPRELIDRPKSGFAVPFGEWLKSPLRDWAESLLSESLIRKQGYLNPEIINKCWHEHLSGKRDWKYRLWNILMFQAWLAEYESN